MEAAATPALDPGRKPDARRLDRIAFVEARDLRDRYRDERRVPDRRQRHEMHAVRKVCLGARRERDGHPRLSAPAGTGQRQQPRAVEQASSLYELILSADEAGAWARQTTRTFGACGQYHGNAPAPDGLTDSERTRSG